MENTNHNVSNETLLNFTRNFTEREDYLLLNNGFIDSSILLSIKFCFYRLKSLLENFIYRIFFIGPNNSTELMNCFLSKNLLIDLNNIVVIVKINNRTHTDKLFKARISTHNSISETSNTSDLFVESDLICEGIENIKIELKKIDQYNFDEIINKVYIIHTDVFEIQEQLEFILIPTLHSLREIVKLDENQTEESDLKVKNKIIDNIKKYSNSITEDTYFKNFIYNKKIRKNILFSSFNSQDILKKTYFEYLNFVGKITSSTDYFIKQFIILNNPEDILTSEFLKDLAKVTINETQKMSIDEKKEIYKNIVTQSLLEKLGYNDSIVILFASSFYILLNRLIKNEYLKLSYNRDDEGEGVDQNIDILKFIAHGDSLHIPFTENLYLKKENSIYKSFEEFRVNKLEFFLKKSVKYEEEFTKLEKIFFNLINYHKSGQLNYFNNCYQRYWTIISDVLNIIPIENCSSIKIRDQIDLDSTVSIYKNLIEDEYDIYNMEMVRFYSDFANEMEDYFNKEIENIDKWCKSIYFYTNKKIQKLITKFLVIFQELKLKLDIYFNEIVEKDLRLVIEIKNKLNSSGYLNDFLSNYLINIEITLPIENIRADEKLINDYLVFGISGGVGAISGILSFGLTRILATILTDAVTGSVAGPIGVAVGASIGAVSIFGSSTYYLVNNKKKFYDKYTEFLNKAKMYRDIVYDKMNEFRTFNKMEIEDRIKKLIIYVELSLKISNKFSENIKLHC